MSTFELVDAVCLLKPNAQLVSAGTVSRGGKSVKTVDVKAVIEVDVSDDIAKGIDFLFPGISMYLKSVASLEHYKGEDRSSRTSLPEMNIDIHYNESLVLSKKNCPIKGRAQLKINKEGEAKLILRPLMKLDESELPALAEYIDSDLRVTCEPMQIDIEHQGESNVKAIRRQKTA